MVQAPQTMAACVCPSAVSEGSHLFEGQQGYGSPASVAEFQERACSSETLTPSRGVLIDVSHSTQQAFSIGLRPSLQMGRLKGFRMPVSRRSGRGSAAFLDTTSAKEPNRHE
jgi:hypothetical protein